MDSPLFSWFSKNLGAKAISFMIAVLLWFVVLGSRTVEVNKDVPIEITTAEDVLIANEVPDRVSFKLAGPKAFLRTILDRRDPPIRVNLSAERPGNVTYRFFSDNIRLPIGVKVLSIQPASTVIRLENVRKKKIPIRLDLRGELPEGYRLTSAETVPPEIQVKGARTAVSDLKEIMSLPVDISELRQGIEQEVPLDMARYNVVLDDVIPKLVLKVEPVTANFRIRNIPVRVISSHRVKLKEKTVTVFVRASQDELKGLDASKVQAEVNLSGKPKGKYQEEVRITLPPQVGFVRAQPKFVNVTLY